VLIIFIILSFDTFSQDLPPINIPCASYAVTSDGHLLGYYGEKNRVDIKSTSNVSKYVILCLIATEDRDFYNHDGVSVKGIIRGIFKTITGRIEGGSTITMQLARNLFLTNERTITRKIEEIDLARKLERKFTKDEILLMYLNTVYFGHGTYGIWAASEEYFGKTPNNLTITESAALVGLVQSPSGYDPVKNAGKMLRRRNIVLHNLFEVGKLNKNEYDKLKKTPLGLKMNNSIGKFFMEYVRREAVDILNRKGIYLDKDELKITTTLNFEMQEAAEDAVNSQWNKFPKTMKSAQIGLVSVQPGTGMIRAMVGGNPDADPRGLNRAVQIHRQPGSSFKPFLYGSLLEKGYTLAEPLLNEPIVVDSGSTDEWRPQNDDNDITTSPITMEAAIQHSINLSAAYAISHLTTPDTVAAFAHRLGIQSNIPNFPSIALGTGEVTPLEMALSYSVFADEGLYARPFSIIKIEDKNGHILFRKSAETTTVLDSATAFLTTTALKEVVNDGTASSIKRYYNGVVAGKTGTTQNYTDAWFVGYNPELSTSIWIGFDNPKRKLHGSFQYGGTACAPIWGKMMSEISKKIKGFGYTDFKTPHSISYVELCEDTGEPIGANCSKEKVYPVNTELLALISALHHPELKEKFDINYGW
jgi:penicillin-binding protein 1A